MFEMDREWLMSREFASEEPNSPKHTLHYPDIDQGFPRLYIDIWQLQLLWPSKCDQIYKKDPLRQFIKRHTRHLDMISLEEFLSHLEELDDECGEEFDAHYFMQFPRFSIDREVVLHLVGMEPHLLVCAQNRHLDDYEIIMTAVRKDGLALEYVSERLLKDKNVALTAVRNAPFAIGFLPDSLQADSDVLRAVYENCGHLHFLQSLPSHVLKESRVIDAIVTLLPSSNMRVLPDLPECLRYNASFLLKLAQRFQGDEDFSLVQVTHPTLWYSRQFVWDALDVDKSGHCVLSACSGILQNDKEIVLKAISRVAKEYHSASEKLKNDPEVLAAFEKSKKEQDDLHKEMEDE
eukprot:CAMPEP_0117436536 /NCGR_PEP_ID=MMETSP0759-20121206/1058_1 /TAXON_ID=63605 /ORGANISM="Percolomonas cosmopolitus, Strain WS" /LENGTH=348 /DNA_ID=CAMNT_0005228139 /DNA_START=276 /DNA_END=1322 /DNA_ORIENTATION=+